MNKLLITILKMKNLTKAVKVKKGKWKIKHRNALLNLKET